MAEKEVGYVELEWRCPSCGNRNPGSAKKCAQCGAPLTDEIQFEQAPQEQILTDQAKIAAAQAGADVQCGYCGTANPATAAKCRQCGADLTEGKARAAGQVLGGFRDQPAPALKCPSCGVENPATALKCSKCGAALAQPKPKPAQPVAARPFPLALVLAILLACCVLGAAGMFLSSRTTDTIGEVRSVQWQRAIAIEALVPVVREAWKDEIPAGKSARQCVSRVHHTQPDPAPGAREICGTPYTIDQGSGFGKVVKQCVYEVYADWCRYDDVDWRVVDTLAAQGNDLNPRWPDLRLGSNQRAGGRQEQYQVVFMGNDKTFNFAPPTGDQFVRFSPGSRWKLKVNTFGAITGVEPATGGP
jgi:DNA-directed RNA polymerase subunit RPC12/RpoP